MLPQLNAYLRLPLQDPQSSAVADPNSPELFKQNLHLVHSHILRLQALARNILSAIHNAYQLGISPAQTEADIATLKQDLQTLMDLMRQTGVGSLPLHPTDEIAHNELNPDAITRATTVLYERLQRVQENAGTVVNLLGPPPAAAVVAPGGGGGWAIGGSVGR